MISPIHTLNWFVGWSLILTAFVAGAVIGLFFHKDDFWDGYGSFRRRLVRLGHVALAALGMLNVIFSVSPWPQEGTATGKIAALCFILGGLAMPLICFLTAWKKECRHFFFIPVTALVVAVITTILGGI